mmetsp:Transcript_10472/g.23779  ORF Transcript_10472/g.23779 Transcript_10472/m.23779 type:complete len:255 (+) Transcript_10472:75-839(+)|eukprot:CAMPEP_0178405674 /NCGR_PEP_ID=MMETSP0689_2-20121128/18521_1 /TAXON_ID=160604 /ORGANISM="Amphidinium massartii, Strain CS-259" /LENGTH=254 /DNA_ID=CAMNT_0020026697 /DNA_START=56 /DNA_END=820 /DNA_ORIENTATION=-
MQFAEKESEPDKESVLKAVRQFGMALNFAPSSLKADKEIVLEAVRRDGYALCYTTPALKADKDVVLEAVRQNGLALLYATAALKADKDVGLEAVRQNGLAFGFVDASLQADKDVLLESVKDDPKRCLELVLKHDELLSDTDFIATFLDRLPDATIIRGITFFRVTLLSGRSAIFHDNVKLHHAAVDLPAIHGQQMLHNLMGNCAAHFRFNGQDLIDNGELLDASTSAPVLDDRDLAAFDSGRIHELQLIVKVAA